MLILEGIPYLCEKEISAKYGLSIPWLRKARITGKTPKYYKFCRKVLYTTEDVDTWLKENIKSKCPP